MIRISHFALGPVLTNAYLMADEKTGEAAVIDPAWSAKTILAGAGRNGWKIRHLWLTHAHFDHLGAVAEIAATLSPPPSFGLHPADLPIWRLGGGGDVFGFHVNPGPKPDLELQDGMLLTLGSTQLEVRHTPGHTPGHCIFYCATEKVVFSGDLIFKGSVGRTDLPGGDSASLEASIRRKVCNLPEDTRILSGHGPETTVGYEKQFNPFVRIERSSGGE